MAKAILELEMPESCFDCVLSTKKEYNGNHVWVCAAYNHRVELDISAKHRHKDCPLKLVEGKEVE